MRNILVIVAIAGLVQACANPSYREKAIEYHKLGLEAERAKNYGLAEENYAKALENAKQGNITIADISSLSYNLGRVKGYLCNYKEAEQLLLKALELEKQASGPVSPPIMKRNLELARFYFDRDEYDKSVRFYRKAMPMVLSGGLEKSDPMALVDILNEYSDALMKLGDTVLSKKARIDAEFIKSKHLNARPRFIFVRYNQDCK
jgi:tetratricopeptide (TPR) repeat protein